MSAAPATGIVAGRTAMGNPTTNRAASQVAENRAKAIRDCVERTLPTAYSLALRISGSAEQAAAACERSYGEWSASVPGASGWGRAEEARFLGRVRAHALAGRREAEGSSAGSSVSAKRSYERDGKGWQALGLADPLGRQAVELAYFGGMNASSIADLLEEPVEDVRAAMRRALLALARPEGSPAEHDYERD